MTMISIAKEKQIRLLLKDGLTNREVAKRARVSRDTVATIKKSPELRKRPPPKRLKRLRKPRRCKTCGTLLKTQLCLLCHPEIGRYDDPKLEINPKRQYNGILLTEVPELVVVAKDVCELHKLHLIHHVLFRSLASRAKDSLQKLFIKTGERNDAKEA